jgi:hypothetical protein
VKVKRAWRGWGEARKEGCVLAVASAFAINVVESIRLEYRFSVSTQDFW